MKNMLEGTNGKAFGEAPTTNACSDLNLNDVNDGRKAPGYSILAPAQLQGFIA